MDTGKHRKRVSIPLTISDDGEDPDRDDPLSLNSWKGSRQRALKEIHFVVDISLYVIESTLEALRESVDWAVNPIVKQFQPVVYL